MRFVGLALFLFSSFGITFNVSAEPQSKLQRAIVTFPEQKLSISIPYKADYRPTEDPVQLKSLVVKKFKTIDFLENEVNLNGYTFKATSEKGLITADPFRTQKLSWGIVYEWNTPTKGSAFYSYACRNGDDYCFRVGPYAMITLNWADAEFIRLK